MITVPEGIETYMIFGDDRSDVIAIIATEMFKFTLKRGDLFERANGIFQVRTIYHWEKLAAYPLYPSERSALARFRFARVIRLCPRTLFDL